MSVALAFRVIHRRAPEAAQLEERGGERAVELAGAAVPGDACGQRIGGADLQGLGGDRRVAGDEKSVLGGA